MSQIRMYLSKIAWKIIPNYMTARVINKMQHTPVFFYGDYEATSHINENCSYFLSENDYNNVKLKNEITFDIIKSYFIYGTNANEYFSYKFPHKTKKERKSYLPRVRKDELIRQYIGKDWKNCFNQLRDKLHFYSLAKDYFGRDVCKINSQNDLTEFQSFIIKHKKCIIKPTEGGCGTGIFIINLKDYDENPQKVFDYLLSKKTSLIAEEIVEQDYRLAEWNSTSLNTLRIPAFRTKEGIKILYPSLRTGRAGSIIDNAGSGGTFAAIDSKTGIIISEGYDKRGHSYELHPDSNKKYLGSSIPQWDELLIFVEKLFNSMPKEHKYIAFDLALSTKGWVVIEANWGEMSMPQIEFGKGLYNDFKKYLFN